MAHPTWRQRQQPGATHYGGGDRGSLGGGKQGPQRQMTKHERWQNCGSSEGKTMGNAPLCGGAVETGGEGRAKGESEQVNKTLVAVNGSGG